MPNIHPVFSSSIVMIIPAVASMILFYRIQRNQILITKSFFWNYAFGFALLSLVNIPIFFFNLGVQISYNALLILYAIGFFAVLSAYLLFYRGTVSLFIKNTFFNTVIPLIAFPFFSVFILLALFLLKIETSVLYTVGVWGFLIPLDAFLGSLFFYFFIKGAPFDSPKRKPSILLMSLAWFLLLVLEAVLWYEVVIYPAPVFWIIKIASMKNWFWARAAAYLLLLIGSLLYSRRLEHPEMVEKP